MILEALIQGGWPTPKEEDDDDKKSSDAENDESEHSLVNSILKTSEEGQMVQSALNNQTVSCPAKYLSSVYLTTCYLVIERGCQG